jgi:hypothetical protein
VKYGDLTRDFCMGFLGVGMSCARVGGGAASVLPIKSDACLLHSNVALSFFVNVKHLVDLGPHNQAPVDNQKCLNFRRGDNEDSPQPIEIPQISAKDDPSLPPHRLPGTCELFKHMPSVSNLL